MHNVHSSCEHLENKNENPVAELPKALRVVRSLTMCPGKHTWVLSRFRCSLAFKCIWCILILKLQLFCIRKL